MYGKSIEIEKHLSEKGDQTRHITSTVKRRGLSGGPRVQPACIGADTNKKKHCVKKRKMEEKVEVTSEDAERFR